MRLLRYTDREALNTCSFTEGVDDDSVHPQVETKHAAKSTSTNSFFIPYFQQPG